MNPVFTTDDFEWDEGNINKVLNNGRGITQAEILECFNDFDVEIKRDPKHSTLIQKFTNKPEKRFILIGRTSKMRYLFIGFIKRKKKIRVYTSRDMHQKEILTLFNTNT